MSITTKSVFFYGHTITTNNSSIDFSEGAGEIQATLNPGSYTLTEFIAEVSRALNVAGALTYTVTVNRTTRFVTIAATGNFELLISTGTRVASSTWTLLGFSGADLTGSASYEGTAGSGSEFAPQALLDNYIPKEYWLQKQDAVVSKASSGIVQQLNFGDVRFYQMAINYQTNNNPTGHPDIDLDVAGITNLKNFLEYCITKAPIEFMPDKDTRSTYDKLIIETTPASKDGTEVVLQKLEGVAGYYNSGTLEFRVVD